jgi:hypothetical protein
MERIFLRQLPFIIIIVVVIITTTMNSEGLAVVPVP